MEKVTLGKIVEKLESGSREKGGSIDSGIISIGGTHLANNGGFRWDKAEFISEDFYFKMRSGKIQNQDILIVKDGATTGKTSFVDESFPFKNAAINEHVFRLRINQIKANPKYVFYFLHSPTGQEQILNDFRGATVGGISRGFIDKVEIPLPNLETQNKIVAILDKAKAILDKREKTILLYDELLKATFIEMFGDPVSNPKDWNQVTLAEICSKITDGTHKTPNYLSNGVRFISAKNIVNNSISWEDTKYISENESNLINSRCNPEFEDILLTKSGSLGQAALVSVDFKFSLFESLALIKYKRNIVRPAFLITYLMSDGVAYFYKQRHKGVAIKHLHLIDIKSIPVFLPPIEIQRKFEFKYHQILKLRAQIKYSRVKCYELLDSFSQQIFSEKITIDIDAELGALINAIDIDKKDEGNKIDSIKEDLTFLQRLIDKLQEQDFENSDRYEKAKYIVFRIMTENPNLIKQHFNSVDKKVMLEI